MPARDSYTELGDGEITAGGGQFVNCNEMLRFGQVRPAVFVVEKSRQQAVNPLPRALNGACGFGSWC